MKVYNSAAWLVAEKARPLSVLPAPFPDTHDNPSILNDPQLPISAAALQPDDLIIRTRAVAINPVDWKLQTYGDSAFPIPYPAILGADVAGEIIHVGSALASTQKFKVSQRVIGHALGFSKGWAYSGFQKFVVLKGATVSVLPDDISFEWGVVLPVSVSTATAGLFWHGTLGLRLPEETKEAGDKRRSGKRETLLLWGGSSSVGSSVVQLATAAGYAVVATASASNFGYVKGLGAVAVLDYHDERIVEKLIHVLKGTQVVGAYDSIGTDSTVRQTAAVLRALDGGKIASVGAAPDDLGEGVEAKWFSAGSIDVQDPEIGQAIWGEFVPQALENGRLRPLPEPLVVGHGLEKIQEAMDIQKAGVSARKVVVTI
ncbi:GroES-like protein [Naviculisporaceae sp. PSN 640]